MEIRGQPIVLSVATHPGLGDHRLSGRPVLPLASALDFLAAFGEWRPPFTVEGIGVRRGVILYGETATIQARRDGEGFALDEIRPSGRRVEAFHVERVRMEAQPVPPRPQDEGTIDDSLPLERFYAEYAFHGPSLRAVNTVRRVMPRSVEGTIRVSRPADLYARDARPAWHIDVVALDGVFQLGLFGAAILRNCGLLPLSIDALMLQAPFPDRPFEATVTMVLQDELHIVCDAIFEIDGRPFGGLRALRGRIHRGG